MIRTLGIALLALSIGFAEEKKTEKTKTTTTTEENSVKKVGKDTGEAVAEGSKKAASATVKGTKWLVRPWSKSKDESSSGKKPAEKKSEKSTAKK